MIKANGFVIESAIKDGGSLVKASLVADTSSEVSSIGTDCSTVVGLSDDDKLSFGSTCLCVNGDFGMLGSDNVWHF